MNVLTVSVGKLTLFTNKNATFHEARHLCAEQGLRLMDIESAEENGVLTAVLQER